MPTASGTPRSPHVLLVEARLPRYRVSAWEALRDELSARGVSFDLAVGAPAQTDAKRNDEGELAWALRCPTSFHTVGRLRFRNIHSAPLLGRLGVTHVILEQALTDLGTFRTWITARRQGASVAVLGHGRNYLHPGSSARNTVKARLTRRADWVFAYTTGGAEHLQTHGLSAGRMTAIGNSTEVSPPPQMSEVAEYRRKLGLTNERCALFLGALQPRKGLDELCEAAEIVRRSHPGFQLLVGGDGPLRDSLDAKRRDGYPISLLGHLDGHTKSLALSLCDFVVVPRQLGLVVVDAMAAGRPIVTMKGAWHGPESEYLVDGSDSLWAQPSPSGLAAAMCRLIESEDLRRQMQDRARRSYSAVSIENMVANFADGVCAWIGTGT